ncbi:MAG: S41 family peptidase [Planctomycetota bacterium]
MHASPRRRPSAAAYLATVLGTCALTASAQSKLLRHPDVFGDQVVFTYGGDLYRAPLAGGTAMRLTTTPGIELFAKFSPDGRWIAFTGQVHGDEQVCVIPSSGGEVRQLTWHPATGPLPARWGYDNQVYGWTPDGTSVLFRSLRDAWTLTGGRLYTVPLPAVARRRGALPVALPMPIAGAGAFSPDGERIVYAPLFRDFRTWKRYQGGWAQELWLFDPTTNKSENISNHVRADRDPMWIEDRIWFASDRSGTMNLWSYDTAAKTVHQETSSSSWDVRWPSAGGPEDHAIVFEQGGELCYLDTETRERRTISIRVPDEGEASRPRRVDAQPFIESYDLSPGGRRAVFAARGELLTVPKKNGDVRDLTHSPGAHDKAPAFSPDGSTIAFVSDRSGDEQLWLIDHLGTAASLRQLTKDLTGMLQTPDWSPDGTKLAFSDHNGVLRVCDVASGELTIVADEPRGMLRDHRWSPCSGWLSFSMSTTTDLTKLHLYSLADQTLHNISRELSNDRQPVFSRDGERLFFIGMRGFQPRLPGAYEWDFQVDRADGIYALALREDLPALFGRLSDEAVVAAEGGSHAKAAAAGPAEDSAEEPADETKPAITRIDLDGIAQRVEALPIELDNYAGLVAAEDGQLIYAKRGGSYYGRGSDRPTTLHAYSLADRKSVQLASGLRGYSLGADGKHLLIQTGAGFAVAKASTAGKDAQSKLDLSALRTTKVAADEHWQIFQEVWRRYRDFFYVANMHGIDWLALREQYAPLVAHVRHRSDLNYVIGEMIAELSVGHAYISGGDLGTPDRPDTALLGCTLRFDQQSGRYRIDRILAGENDSPTYRSPATAVGVRLQAGDYVLAIDGEELQPQTNPYRKLQHKAGRTITLTVHTRPSLEGARTVELQPVTSHSDLHYHAWVEANRARVHKLSDGKLGYVHLPNMGAEGIREFIRQYYPQRDKQGLVIDDRFNGGGNVSQMVLNRLSRKLLMCTFGRTTGYDPYPNSLFHGHLVCLLNETSASDGDIFPAMFKRQGLGPLIGKRSWGGIIGITNRGMLLDGGTVNVPEFGNTEPGPKWTIEGEGVTPDIEVDNDTESVLRGEDPQLQKGIEVLLERIQADPRPLPTAPPAPIKTGR